MDSNNVRTAAAWVCMHWWHSCQMAKEGRNGAISTQSVLIVSTLCWWAAAAPSEMTTVYVLERLLWLVLWGTWIQPEGTENRDGKLSTYCMCCYSHLVDLFLTLLVCLCCSCYSLFAWSNITASLFHLLMCLLFHLALPSASLFLPLSLSLSLTQLFCWSCLMTLVSFLAL